jgi:phosphoribosylformylglycinamidine (FGAM) synthase-like enzyme
MNDLLIVARELKHEILSADDGAAVNISSFDGAASVETPYTSVYLTDKEGQLVATFIHVDPEPSDVESMMFGTGWEYCASAVAESIFNEVKF